MDRTIRVLSKTYSQAYLRRLKAEVDKSIKWLGRYPKAGQFEGELEWLGLGHRRIVVGPFKIVYRILGDRIVVNDIFDSRRDPKGMKA
ncbi:MAG: type II toxin-antitoxin system RelE/ParE family toxin [Flavobacteriales bacterium]|nr:type II toxin-antitoxin system RelE/ParE family toxin [Flavobacteriales bacterium]